VQNTRYRLTSPHPVSFKACVVADLHDRPFGEILPILKEEKPDLILIPGDLTETLRDGAETAEREGLRLLRECASIAPTFYTLGNHEIGGCHGNIRRAKRADQPLSFTLSPTWREIINATGATFLHQEHILWNGLVIGAIYGLVQLTAGILFMALAVYVPVWIAVLVFAIALINIDGATGYDLLSF